MISFASHAVHADLRQGLVYGVNGAMLAVNVIFFQDAPCGSRNCGQDWRGWHSAEEGVHYEKNSYQ